MTEADLQKAYEIADELVNGGFAEKDSFEYVLSEALIELKKRLDSFPIRVRPWEFNFLSFEKEDVYGKPLIWAQWPTEERK
jgi:hypothetical protein